jgi:hypothetical protein
MSNPDNTGKTAADLPDYQTQIIQELARQVTCEFGKDEVERSKLLAALEPKLPEFTEWVHQQLPIAHVFGLDMARNPAEFIRFGLSHLI